MVSAHALWLLGVALATLILRKHPNGPPHTDRSKVCLCGRNYMDNVTESVMEVSELPPEPETKENQKEKEQGTEKCELEPTMAIIKKAIRSMLFCGRRGGQGGGQRGGQRGDRAILVYYSDRNQKMDYQQPSSSGLADKKRSNKGKVFQLSWLKNNIFKDWLKSDNNKKAFCTACNKVLACGKSELIRHSRTQLHIKNTSKSCDITPSVLLPKVDSNSDLDHVNKVKTAEIKLAAFYAEHNIAFQTINHMVPLLKETCSDPQVVKDLKLSRTKYMDNVTESVMEVSELPPEPETKENEKEKEQKCELEPTMAIIKKAIRSMLFLGHRGGQGGSQRVGQRGAVMPVMPESWYSLPPPLSHSDVPATPTSRPPCWHTQA
ncbi:hypothetical protein WN55_08220 [Dufourea novaeangliae]|uniref:BED-type domain-containing protein n=1 Tax=Dufourea novaeangliae TaxID=178035 RepID=A0A154PSP6_DUFNO|nr:hypothetical protein WN55_08220 [Dufourea novaeangliae]